MSWPKVCGPTTPSTVMPACVWNLAHGSARRGPELVVDHDVDVVEAEPFLDQAHLGAAVALRVRLVKLEVTHGSRGSRPTFVRARIRNPASPYTCGRARPGVPRTAT